MKKLISLVVALVLVLSLSAAFAEWTVVIVFYEDDTFIVEDAEGNREIYDDRGDLVPGDKLEIFGDEIKLTSQSNWDYFDKLQKGDPVASFLYPEDAEYVQEVISK